MTTKERPRLPDETLKDWGKRLKNRRGSIGQVRLSKIAGVDQSTISRIERGQIARISDDLKWRLAGALGCLVEDLFPYPNVRPPFPVTDEAA